MILADRETKRVIKRMLNGRASDLGADSESYIFVSRRKYETRDLVISLSDEELMRGFRGLLDDAFESMLLMSIDV